MNTTKQYTAEVEQFIQRYNTTYPDDNPIYFAANKLTTPQTLFITREANKLWAHPYHPQLTRLGLFLTAYQYTETSPYTPVYDIHNLPPETFLNQVDTILTHYENDPNSTTTTIGTLNPVYAHSLGVPQATLFQEHWSVYEHIPLWLSKGTGINFHPLLIFLLAHQAPAVLAHQSLLLVMYTYWRHLYPEEQPTYQGFTSTNGYQKLKCILEYLSTRITPKPSRTPVPSCFPDMGATRNPWVNRLLTHLTTPVEQQHPFINTYFEHLSDEGMLTWLPRVIEKYPGDKETSFLTHLTMGWLGVDGTHEGEVAAAVLFMLDTFSRSPETEHKETSIVGFLDLLVEVPDAWEFLNLPTAVRNNLVDGYMLP